MTEARKDGIVPDPSQLAEMQVTDATLDRLAARAPEPADLDDPVFAALAGLAGDVDAVDMSEQDQAVARLVEVLDGRPLWVLDGEDLAGAEGARDVILLDDPAWEEHARQVIDLRRAAEEAQDAAGDSTAETVGSAPSTTETDETAETAAAETAARATEAAGTEPDADDEKSEAPETVAMPIAARAADEPGAPAAPSTTVTPVSGSGKAGVLPLRRVPRQARENEDPWVRALRKVSLPAAAAITLFTLGGGITAALTGDPMAPLDGVSRVVDSIAGTDDSRTTYSSLEENLQQARTALQAGDLERAANLVAQAREGLDEIPEAEKDELQRQLEAVQNEIASAPNAPATAPSVATGVPTVAPSPEVTTSPTVTSNPEPSATESSATTPPSATPSATPEPSGTQPSAEPSTQDGTTTGAGTGGSTGGAAGGTGNSSDG